jgi:hypothetical protein
MDTAPRVPVLRRFFGVCKFRAVSENCYGASDDKAPEAIVSW